MSVPTYNERSKFIFGNQMVPQQVSKLESSADFNHYAEDVETCIEALGLTWAFKVQFSDATCRKAASDPIERLRKALDEKMKKVGLGKAAGEGNKYDAILEELVVAINRKLLNVIEPSVSRTLSHATLGRKLREEGPAAVWARLHQQLGYANAGVMYDITKAFHEAGQEPGETIRSYADRLVKLRDQLTSTDYAISDAQFVEHFVRKSDKRILHHVDLYDIIEKKKTAAEVVDMFILHGTLIEREDTRKNHIQEVTEESPEGRANGPRSRGIIKGRCWRCGQEGHMERVCTAKKTSETSSGEQKQKQRAGRRSTGSHEIATGATNHVDYVIDQASVMQFSEEDAIFNVTEPQLNTARTIPTVMNDPPDESWTQVTRLNARSHRMKHCPGDREVALPHLPPRVRNPRFKACKTQPVSIHDPVTGEQITAHIFADEKYFRNYDITANEFYTGNIFPRPDEVVLAVGKGVQDPLLHEIQLDGGSTATVVTSSKYAVPGSITPINPISCATARRGKGVGLEIRKRCIVEIVSYAGDGKEGLTLRAGAYICEEASSNLLSEQVFDADGWKVQGGQGLRMLSKDGIGTLTFRRRVNKAGFIFNGFLRVFDDKPSNSNTVMKVSIVRTNNSVRNIHKLLGHPPAQVIKRMEAIVGGLEVNWNRKRWKEHQQEIDSSCETCLVGNIQRPIHVPKAVSSVSPDPGAEVSVDLGIVSTKGHGGATCFCLTVDGGTGYYDTRILPSKDVEIAVKGLCNRYKNVNGAYPTRIRADLGGENVAQPLTDWLVALGIDIVYASPREHNTNPKAERGIGLVKALASKLLFEARLPKTFWPYAIEHATYLINLRPSPQCPLMTRYEAVFGCVPDITRLQHFGSIVY
ncbi:MAG: zinc finger domain-containing protein, partial [Porticoccaceae bacterium]|nr:zinc finger domain-containing protein [Porticoccaceae bacterium]